MEFTYISNVVQKVDVKKKKILFVLPTLNMGGAEKVTVNILNKLDKNLFNITLVVIDSKYKHLESYIDEDIDLKYLKITKTRNAFFAIFKQIIIFKPTIVYSTLNRTNILILIIKLLYPYFKVLIREPSMPSAQIKNNYMSRSMKFLIKFLYPYANKIIVQTKYMKDEIEHIFNIDRDKVIVMNNPIDKKAILKSLKNQKNPFLQYKDNCNFIYVGRLSNEKNPLYLVDIFKKVVIENDKFHLFIIGDGYLKDEINKKIIDNNLINNIHVLGFRSNPYPFIKYSDALLLSSKWEGMPNIAIEALFLKKIVITTDSTPILKDLITDGKNGFIIKDFDIDKYTNCILNYKTLTNEFQDIIDENFNSLFLEI